MKKDIITWCLFLMFLASCSSRKVNVSKTEIKTNTDSISVVRIDSTSQVNNNINISESIEELEVCPLIDSLPIIINGISYKNAVLKYKKQNKVLVDTSKKITSKNVLKKELKKKTETKTAKNKSIDKKINNFVYLWLILIPVGMYLYRQLKKKILL